MGLSDSFAVVNRIRLSVFVLYWAFVFRNLLLYLSVRSQFSTADQIETYLQTFQADQHISDQIRHAHGLPFFLDCRDKLTDISVSVSSAPEIVALV